MFTDARVREDEGLSPRRRGNPYVLKPGERCYGSIPAQAGGTRLARVRLAPVRGLSPRRRGNRSFGFGDGVVQRSIPAQAGNHLRLLHEIGGEGSIPAQAGEPI